LERAGAQSCSTVNGVYTCTVPFGSYSSNILFQAPTDSSGNAPFMSVSSDGIMTVPANQSSAYSFIASGRPGLNAENGGTGGNGQGMFVTSLQDLTMTAGHGGTYLFGLFAQVVGGKGGSATADGSGRGAGGGNAGLLENSQYVQVSNSGAVTIDLPTITVGSGAALFAASQGGTGGAPGYYNGSPGGSGGQSAGAQIQNLGNITVSLSGAYGYGGIEALGQGGAGGGYIDGSAVGNGSAFGGGGGSSSVINSAPINVAWKWQGATSPNYGLFGILAQSLGGNGSFGNGSDGGNGGYGPTPSATVALTSGGNVTVTQTGTPAVAAIGKFYGAGVATQLAGGDGGSVQGLNSNGPYLWGGNGGWVGTSGLTTAQISVTDASVTTSGEYLPALLLFSQAGAGGCGGGLNCSGNGNPDTNGGAGGLTGNGLIKVNAVTLPVTLSTASANSPAIVALLQGGSGGVGGDFNGSYAHFGVSNAGDGGPGGYASTTTVSLAGTSSASITVTTMGKSAPGISAASIGGAGGNGGGLTDVGGGAGGTGGAGGAGGDVVVSLTAAGIVTQGTGSPGIAALSQGGTGGGGGTATTDFAKKDRGGNGGTSGNVEVTLDGTSKITTFGVDASGIVAQSVSGGGGNAGYVVGTASAAGGNGGNGGNTGTVSVSNEGAISTAGATARGILAQASSGGGGSGGGAGGGVLFDGAGTGGSTGLISPITITNSGSITTSGANAQGILAQSLAGGGGAGGQAGGLIVVVGGNASINPLTANAGQVNVLLNSGSNVSTSGQSSIGVLGQSIGGGGGDGGGVQGGAVSVGGSGGAGGSGGSASGVMSGGTIKTLGDGAHGFVMQSIGGGGGNAGNVAGGVGLFASVALGGSGGSGGAGGAVILNLTGNTGIIAEGSKAAGLVAQSIGGGGGSGGQAFTGSVGVGFSASVAVGGSGGAGGDGSQVSVQIVGGSIATGQNPLLTNQSGSSGLCTKLPCNELPIDSHGVVVQSIGGGGGIAGSASAKALAFAVPVDESNNQVAVASTVALGGKGGSGGNANYATFAVSQGGSLVTSGQGANGVLLQGIGGGGGAGGDSSATSMAVGYGVGKLPPGAKSISVTTEFTIGGQGGSGGFGGGVYTALGGVISFDQYGYPVLTADRSGSPTSTITTYGDFADGIKAQSIGGGGGDAGHGSGNTQAFGTGTNSMGIGINLGAKGGGGGGGGYVAAALFPTSAITTWGSNAIGVLAQNIGGGGGASQGGSYSFGGPVIEGVKPTVKYQIGTQGASGGTGGEVVVSVQGPIETHGGDSIGVLAQSIGGGGGVGGSAGSDASADNPIIRGLNIRQGFSNIANESVNFDATYTVAVGGQGGGGNVGGPVEVSLASKIFTSGDWASGVVAQSIGGGGGKGGTATATGTGGRPDITVNLNLAVGGTGGQEGTAAR
jgi:hypothetical protein